MCIVFFYDIVLISLDKFNYVHLHIQFQLKFAIFIEKKNNLRGKNQNKLKMNTTCDAGNLYKCLNEWRKNVGYHTIWKFPDVWIGYGASSSGKIASAAIIRNTITI